MKFANPAPQPEKATSPAAVEPSKPSPEPAQEPVEATPTPSRDEPVERRESFRSRTNTTESIKSISEQLTKVSLMPGFSLH